MVILLLALPILAAGLLTQATVRAWCFSEGISEETQGWRLAQSLGCLNCHGTWGEGGVPNPGAKKVPGFQDFAFMMSIDSEYELREWILDGAPEDLRKERGFEAAKSERALTMPAYRDRLNQGQVDRLVMFYHGISGTKWPLDPQAQKGFNAARDAGCFGCHGPGGRFDMPNPGSFIGRIPSWHGADFVELARDEDEVRAWILDGRPQRLAKHPLANWFLNRQLLKMPAYRGKLDDSQIEAIMAYIGWLRDPSAPGHRPSFGSFEDPFSEF